MTKIYQYLEPWVEITEFRENIEMELKREITSNHLLHNMKLIAIAQHRLSDDVLFKIDRTIDSFAVVHLTWRGEAETDTAYPETRYFDSFEDWVEKCMIPDHKEFISVQ